MARIPADRTAADLQRAASTLYYALFHELALTCANSIAGDRSGPHSRPAWKQVYRALEHRKSKSYCANKDLIKKFPNQIKDFANHYVSMQEKRHLCDYDPYHVVTETDILVDIETAEKVIMGFRAAHESDKRAFCAFVLFQQR